MSLDVVGVIQSSYFACLGHRHDRGVADVPHRAMTGSTRSAK
jgi:hypothetical protein